MKKSGESLTSSERVGCPESWVPGGNEQWEFASPLFARERARGRGDIHGIAWACVAVHGRIGGLCS